LLRTSSISDIIKTAWSSDGIIVTGKNRSTGMSLYPQVIHSKTYRGYVKPWIITNAIHNMIFM
jgi:hypothetical protein